MANFLMERWPEGRTEYRVVEPSATQNSEGEWVLAWAEQETGVIFHIERDSVTGSVPFQIHNLEDVLHERPEIAAKPQKPSFKREEAQVRRVVSTTLAIAEENARSKGQEHLIELGDGLLLAVQHSEAVGHTYRHTMRGPLTRRQALDLLVESALTNK